MNQTLKIVLFVLAGLLIAAALIFAGFFFGQRQNPQVEFGYGYFATDGNSMPFFNRGFGGMMGGFFDNRGNNSSTWRNNRMGGGMMGGYGYSANSTADSTLTLDSAAAPCRNTWTSWATTT